MKQLGSGGSCHLPKVPAGQGKPGSPPAACRAHARGLSLTRPWVGPRDSRTSWQKPRQGRAKAERGGQKHNLVRGELGRDRLIQVQGPGQCQRAKVRRGHGEVICGRRRVKRPQPLSESTGSTDPTSIQDLITSNPDRQPRYPSPLPTHPTPSLGDQRLTPPLHRHPDLQLFPPPPRGTPSPGPR